MEASAEQIGRWLKQAEHDLEAAQNLVRLESYDHASFLAQQAAEKALKALWIKLQGQIPPRTHNIVRLAAEVSAPAESLEAARLMSGDYMATRYPDVADVIPAEAYTADDAASRVLAAEEILRWVKGQTR